jgi:hypothetical protein
MIDPSSRRVIDALDEEDREAILEALDEDDAEGWNQRL